MDGQPAVYLGRIVPKKNFRVFIYGTNGTKKVVNSWDEYENHMSTGIWFATEEETKEVAAPKKRISKNQKSTEDFLDAGS